ncbi:MAG: RNA 2',3'-cyclic phosphodiesterase [Dehalococcoidia bacterium]|nr:MAG: RNA 2',3'-cyclic phosphodiesterase [Dehalococcoidia bacterium]
MRLFVALEVPEPWREAARAAVEALPVEVRTWLRPERPERLHVTLWFIGEYPEAGVARLRTVLDEYVGSVDLVMELRAAGTFGGSVVWLGVQSEDLDGLVGRVEQAMATAGVAPRDEAFTGHMTIARARRRLDARQRRELAAALRSLPAPPRSPVRVRSATLFESTQERGVSIYRALHRTGS